MVKTKTSSRIKQYHKTIIIKFLFNQKPFSAILCNDIIACLFDFCMLLTSQNNLLKIFARQSLRKVNNELKKIKKTLKTKCDSNTHPPYSVEN